MLTTTLIAVLGLITYAALRVFFSPGEWPDEDGAWELRDGNWEFEAREKYEPSIEEMYADGQGDA